MYRIVKYSNEFSTTYKVQKKAFFGLWYNFNNIDGCTTGFYDTEEEAIKAIAIHRTKTTTEILTV